MFNNIYMSALNLVNLFLSSKNPMLALSIAALIGVACPMIYVDTQHRKEMGSIIDYQHQVLKQNAMAMQSMAETQRMVMMELKDMRRDVDAIKLVVIHPVK